MSNEALNPTAERKELFLKQLRARTTDSHRRLEANPVSTVLLQPEVSVTAYGVYLQKLYGFVAPFEEQIFPVLQALIPDVESRRKTSLLEDDLMVLYGTNASGIPVLNWKESHHNIVAALGAMYVLEGSTLGGNILYKKINITLGFDAQLGAKYFAAYGPLTGKMWKGFLDIFTDYAVLNNCEEEIMNSAVAAFSKIDAWFSA